MTHWLEALRQRISHAKTDATPPDILQYVPVLEPVSDKSGRVTFVSHPFAPKYTEDALLEEALDAGLPKRDLEAARQVLRATGFKNRYSFTEYGGEKPTYEELLDRTAAIGAHLLKIMMQARKWNHIDVLIDTSAFLPPEINERVLEHAGIQAGSVRGKSYRYACAGAVTALVDVLADPSLGGANVAILALEPLSYLMDRRQLTDPATMVMPALFNDGYAALGFNTDSLRVIDAIIRVVPDGGVIKIPTSYDFTGVAHNPDLVPRHYEFEEGGQDILKISDRV